MEKPAKKYYTPEEYLAVEEAAEFRSEYYKGEIFAMSGATVNHNTIVLNVGANLLSVREKQCNVYVTDLKVRIETADMFTYPDVLIICGDLEFYNNRKDIILNPVAIIEVLSESTEGYDRGKKFECYRAIPTLREYILIDQFKMHIEQYCINPAGKWELTEYREKTEFLTLCSVDSRISLETIYERVTFE